VLGYKNITICLTRFIATLYPRRNLVLSLFGHLLCNNFLSTSDMVVNENNSLNSYGTLLVLPYLAILGCLGLI